MNGSALLGHARRRPTEPEVDLTVLWIVALLLGLGLVMVYSASIAIAEAGRVSAGNPSYFLLRHASFLLIGLAACAVVLQLPMRFWQAVAPYLFIFGVGLLQVLLTAPGGLVDQFPKDMKNLGRLMLRGLRALRARRAT